MKTAKYDQQMPFVGNQTQFDLMNAINSDRRVDSKAAVIRASLNLLFGLNANEEIPQGTSIDEVIERARDIVLNPGNYQVVVRAEAEAADAPVA